VASKVDMMVSGLGISEKKNVFIDVSTPSLVTFILFCTSGYNGCNQVVVVTWASYTCC